MISTTPTLNGFAGHLRQHHLMALAQEQLRQLGATADAERLEAVVAGLGAVLDHLAAGRPAEAAMANVQHFRQADGAPDEPALAAQHQACMSFIARFVPDAGPAIALVRALDHFYSGPQAEACRAMGHHERRWREVSESHIANAQALGNFGSWEWDLATNRVSWSDQLYRIYGLEPGSCAITLEGFLERLHPEDRGPIRASIEQAIHDRGTFRINERILRPDGSVRVLESWGEVVADAAGTPLRVLGACHDVTERQHLDAELQQAYRELQAAHTALMELDRAKDEFLSVISHELRTPLNFITGFASTLADEVQGPLNARQQEAISKILNGSDRMLMLVDDLLDYAKMQSGCFDLAPEPTPFGPLVDEVVGLLMPLATRKQLRLAIEVEPALAAPLDPARIAQVLTNLLTNAIKFTEPGGRVHVRAARRDGALVAEVTDTGRGIAPEHHARIFNRFEQVDMSRTREAGGTGLGLAIAKALVEAHGGAIGLESRPGAGSTFWFRLPLEGAIGNG